jgi:hypothetical protein
LLALAACGGDSDEPESGLSSSDEDSTTTSESTTSTTTTTTSTTTTSEPVDSDDQVRQDLMATAGTFWAAYTACGADPAACDVEASLGPFIGQPLRGELDAAFADWAARGIQFESDEEMVYRRHDLALEGPDTYALEVCFESTTRAVYELADDGTRVELDQAPLALVRLHQFALEENGDGGYVIKTMAPNDNETVEGENCDAYREG